jgi:glycosyltransferase involved in cell wall biosynthesis
VKILYVYDGDWPRGATRVVKETRSLAEAGHQVLLVARNSDRAARRERNDWMEIQRLPSVGSKWLNYAINFPLFVNPVWLWTIWRTAVRCNAERIVVADLPLALSALLIGWITGLPVDYDMAEVYPEFLRARWEVDRMRWSDHLVRSPAAASWMERVVLRLVRHVFVVSEESAERCRRLGVQAGRVFVVGNTPEHPELLGAPAASPPGLAPWSGRPLVLFVGILIADRGVVEAVEAFPAVLAAVPDAVLVIVGDGTDRPRIERRIRDLRLERSVALLGWQSHEDLPGFYHQAQVGLVPFLDSSHIRITLANKLFDYMAAGLPVVAVDVPPMRRILEETGAGVLYPPGDAGALAHEVTRLLQDAPLRRKLAERGRWSVAHKYRWSEDARVFVEGVIRTAGS